MDFSIIANTFVLAVIFAALISYAAWWRCEREQKKNSYISPIIDNGKLIGIIGSKVDLEIASSRSIVIITVTDLNDETRLIEIPKDPTRDIEEF